MSNLRSGPGWLTPDLIRRVLAQAEQGAAPMPADVAASPAPAPKPRAKVQRAAAISFDADCGHPGIAREPANDRCPAPRPAAKLALPTSSAMEERFAAAASVQAPAAARASLEGMALTDVEREAFRRRSAQRRTMERTVAPGRLLTASAAVRYLSDKTKAANMAAEHAAAEYRAADPAERARVFLQRKGLIVVRADVVGGKREHWAVSGRGKAVTDAELLAIAAAKGFAG